MWVIAVLILLGFTKPALALTGVGALADQVATGAEIHFWGKTAPWAEVVILEPPFNSTQTDRVVAVAEIESTGIFDFRYKSRGENLNILQVVAVDDVGVTNRISLGAVVGGEVLLPPTIVNDPSDTSTNNAALMGMSYPNSRIDLTLTRNDTDVSQGTTNTNASGYWYYKRSDLPAGKYKVVAKSVFGSLISDISQEIYFEILGVAVPPVVTEVVDQVIESLPDFIETAILEQPETVAKVLAPIAAVPVIGFWLKDLIALLIRLFLGILHFFGWHKERRRFGVVYDSVTKKPLERAIVRLYQVMNDKLVIKETEVTGTNGEFAFLPAAGRYKIMVTRSEYTFPSSIIKARNSDGEYRNLYHGEIFEIKEGDSVEISVPMDRGQVKLDWKFRVKDILTKVWRVIGWVMLIVGLLFAVRSLMLNVTAINISVLVFYIAMIFWNIFNGVRVIRGVSVVVDEKTKKGIMGVGIAVYEVTYQRLVQRRFSDAKGRFLLILPAGKYRIEASTLGYQEYKGSVIEVKGEKAKSVRIKIGLKKR